MPRAKVKAKTGNGNGKRKVGRPTKYNSTDTPRQAFVLMRAGLAYEELAFAFGVTRQCIDNWIWRYPELFASIKSGRDIYDANNVERALLKRALGFNVTETTRERIPTDWNEAGQPCGYKMTVTKEIDKYVVPDVGAAIVWLTNRANICPQCNGSGWVTRDDGTQIECYHCDGTGKRWRRIKEVEFTDSTRKQDGPKNGKGTTNIFFGQETAAEALRVLTETGAIARLLPGRSVSEDDSREPSTD